MLLYQWKAVSRVVKEAVPAPSHTVGVPQGRSLTPLCLLFWLQNGKNSGNCLTGLLGGSSELIHTKRSKQCLKQILNKWAMLLLLVLLSAFSILLLLVLPGLDQVWGCPVAPRYCSHLCLGSHRVRWLSSWLFSSFTLSYLALVASDSLYPQKYNPYKSFYTERDSFMLRESTDSEILLVNILSLPLREKSLV